MQSNFCRDSVVAVMTAMAVFGGVSIGTYRDIRHPFNQNE